MSFGSKRNHAPQVTKKLQQQKKGTKQNKNRSTKWEWNGNLFGFFSD
jgi:hypothetical protein